MIDTIQIAEEWLELKKYDFKILVITTVLADEKRAFRGKLSVLCEYLEIGNSSANKNKIKSSEQFLNVFLIKSFFSCSLIFGEFKTKEKSFSSFKIVTNASNDSLHSFKTLSSVAISKKARAYPLFIVHTTFDNFSNCF